MSHFKLNGIVLMTFGGSAPLNHVIHHLTREAAAAGIPIYGVRYSIADAVANPAENFVFLPEYLARMGDIRQRGGTVLGTQRCLTTEDDIFTDPQNIRDFRDLLESKSINCIIESGGNGGCAFGNALEECLIPHALHFVCITKTVDMDHGTFDGRLFQTIGYDTTVKAGALTYKACYDEVSGYKNRLLIIETPGRHSGGLCAGIAAEVADLQTRYGYGQDMLPAAVIIPELSKDNAEAILQKTVCEIKRTGRRIILFAEGAAGDFNGIHHFKHELAQAFDGAKDIRTVVFGPDIRGAAASNYDQILSADYADAAFKAAKSGMNRVCCATFQGENIVSHVPFDFISPDCLPLPANHVLLQTLQQANIFTGANPIIRLGSKVPAEKFVPTTP